MAEVETVPGVTAGTTGDPEKISPPASHSDPSTPPAVAAPSEPVEPSAQPKPGAGEGASDDNRLPHSRVQELVARAREEGRDGVEQRNAWAEGLDPDTVRKALTRSYAPDVQVADPEPQPDLRVTQEDGSEVLTKSPGREAEHSAWQQRQWDSRLDERLRPLEQHRASSEQSDSLRREEARLRSLPGWTEYEADVLKLVSSAQAKKQELGFDEALLIVSTNAHAAALVAAEQKGRESAGRVAQDKVDAGGVDPGRDTSGDPVPDLSKPLGQRMFEHFQRLKKTKTA